MRARTAIVLLAAASVGCSLLLRLEADQCASPAECEVRGMVGRICVAGQCVLPADAGAPVLDAGVADGDAAPAACLPAGCAPEDPVRPTICSPVKGTCEPLRSAECETILGTYEGNPVTRNPNTIYVGAFGLGRAELESQVVLNYRLALDEINGSGVKGLPPATSGGKRRPLGVVLCRGQESVTGEASRHLLEDVGAPGLLWVSSTDALREMLDAVGDRRRGFVLNLAGSDRVLEARANDRLWHLIPSVADLAPAYAAALQRIEAKRKAATGTSRIRVALLYTDEGLRRQLFDALGREAGLTINGEAQATALTAGTYKVFKADPYAIPKPSYRDVATQLLAFRPDVVLSAAGAELLEVMQLIEPEWAGDAGAAPPPPVYLLSPFNVDPAYPAWVDVARPSPGGLRNRIVGVNAASAADPQIKARYVQRFKGAFPDAPADATSYENAYDGMYFLAAALAAAPGGARALTGDAVGEGMKRLVAGSPFPVGPDDLLLAFDALANGGSIALHGTLGPPSFDPTTHARVQGISLFCLRPSGNALAYAFDESAYIASPDGGPGTFAGTWTCNPSL